jgi:hypothetical protein
MEAPGVREQSGITRFGPSRLNPAEMLVRLGRSSGLHGDADAGGSLRPLSGHCWLRGPQVTPCGQIVAASHRCRHPKSCAKIGGSCWTPKGDADQTESRAYRSAARARAGRLLGRCRHAQPHQSRLRRHLRTWRQRLALNRPAPGGPEPHPEAAEPRRSEAGPAPPALPRCLGLVLPLRPCPAPHGFS